MRISDWSSDVCSSDLTIYRNARITPGGTYRLRGKRGNLPIFRMAQFGPSPVDTGGGIHAFAYSDFAELAVDAQGRFDVVMSPKRPDDCSGDWWELNPEAPQLMIRPVSSDWAGEEEYRESVVEGKSVLVSVDLGGCVYIKKTK